METIMEHLHLAEEADDLNCPVEDIETQDDAIEAFDLQSIN